MSQSPLSAFSLPDIDSADTEAFLKHAISDMENFAYQNFDDIVNGDDDGETFSLTSLPTPQHSFGFNRSSSKTQTVGLFGPKPSPQKPVKEENVSFSPATRPTLSRLKTTPFTFHIDPPKSEAVSDPTHSPKRLELRPKRTTVPNRKKEHPAIQFTPLSPMGKDGSARVKLEQTELRFERAMNRPNEEFSPVSQIISPAQVNPLSTPFSRNPLGSDVIAHNDGDKHHHFEQDDGLSQVEGESLSLSGSDSLSISSHDEEGEGMLKDDAEAEEVKEDIDINTFDVSCDEIRVSLRALDESLALLTQHMNRQNEDLVIASAEFSLLFDPLKRATIAQMGQKWLVSDGDDA
ncbi:hypothetical protein BLNAU_8482 [Blattamonas nauphoetae]|uniref:Uncharacterized protein n=1 Tax=Blattamonas nauphoetae TaxID=2049346 RepID=A0ABQ9XYS2_9EUKA|nr:hypothetical protein BLNAU_8482 [Blattamonas nauphoetae]